MPDPSSPALCLLMPRHLRWAAWEALIRKAGVTIDRPRESRHPRFPEIVYPLDYGYVNDTIGTDGVEIDIFVGSAANGLIGLLATADHRQGDREIKFLYNCSREEVYLANGFINFDRTLLEGTLVLRRPMKELFS